MLAGVLLHFVKAPVPVDAAGNGCAGRGGSGQDIHRMPDDARLLVDVRHPQHRAVRQGQRAPVGGLTAALRVEHCAVQRDAPAAGLFVRLCGKDDAFAFGAESVLLKVFFCALHSASTSCKIERLKMGERSPSQALPRQLPQRGSQAVMFVAKVLEETRKFPAVLLPLPLGEVAANVVSRRRGRTPLALSLKFQTQQETFPPCQRRPLGGAAERSEAEGVSHKNQYTTIFACGK